MLQRIWATLLSTALPVVACSCLEVSACQLIGDASVLFVGEVIGGGVESIREDPWYSRATHFRFRVIERFRGLPAAVETFEINVMPPFGMCSPNPYFPGRRYLVAPARHDNGEFWDGPCFTGRDVERAANELRRIRAHLSGKKLTQVYGQVISGGSKPLAGVRVSTTRRGRTYSTVSGSDGHYVLPLPTGGGYNLVASFSRHELREAPEEVEVEQEGGCAVADISMQVDNSISGSVRDEGGRLLANGRVGLFDVDRAVFHDQVSVDGERLTFTFHHVPLGRYLLVSNPEGRLPYERTYYPDGSTRGAAEVFEFRSSGVHLTGRELVIGKAVVFRAVKIRVQFPDGAPMRTALVACEGQPRNDGDLPWSESMIVGKEGNVELVAPADRVLRIEVRDVYRRALKASYVSTHATGTETIEKTFVVQP